MPPVTTVSFQVAQLIARHKSFVVDFNVPSADIQTGEMPAQYRPLEA
jgi:hypothetical protein